MTYIVNWTKTGVPPDGKPAIILPPLTVDGTSTSLTLTGKGTPNYGEIQQENFVRLLENFASDTPPPYPTYGQIWFNTTDHSMYLCDTDLTWKRVGGIFKDPSAPTNAYEGDVWWDSVNNKLFVYDGAIWGQIYPSLSIVPVAYVEEYNALADLYNRIAATPSGATYATSYGYGQTPVAHTNMALISNPLWLELIGKFAKVLQHQGGSTVGLATRGFILDQSTIHGVVTALQEYNSTIAAIAPIDANRHNVNPLSLESSVLPNSTYTRTPSYYNKKIHDVAFTFTDMNHAKAFFNSGGKMRVNASFTASQSTTFSNAWQTFVNSIGGITFDAQKTTYTGSAVNTPGFYNLALGGVYTTLFTATSAVPGSVGAYIQIKARLEAGTGSAVILRFNIVYAPDGVNSVYSNAYNSANSAAIGSTVSTITTTKANELYLNTNELAYPTVQQGGTFISDSSV